jgi:IclR family transcriptional regulator, acetate operon repressor
MDLQHARFLQASQVMQSTERTAESSVLGKILLIFGAFNEADNEISQSDLVARTELPKTTVNRIISDLCESRMLERSGNRYRLGTRLFELGQLVQRERSLRDAALPFLEDLYEVTHETVNLGVLDGLDVLYVEKIDGHRRFKAPTRVAGRMPLHATGMGKVMLAYSDPSLTERVISGGLKPKTPYSIAAPNLLREEVAEIARTGVAYDREEASVGISCVAAPIFGREGKLVAACSVAAPTHRASPERLAPAVRASSLALSRALSEMR